MTIGDFSRATRLSARALRLYHRVGLLAPAHVDESTGYRRYASDQLPDALLIRRLRAYDMPIDDIRTVLAAADEVERRGALAHHLDRLEAQLDRTRSAVTGLRDLLDAAPGTTEVRHRYVPTTPVVVVRAVIDLVDLGPWYDATSRHLAGLVADGTVVPAGPRGGLWSTELVVEERGGAALYLPLGVPYAGDGLRHGATAEVLAPVTLAVAVHAGPDDTIGQTYAALGEHVTRLAIDGDGPVRETYLRDADADGTGALTEIGWPVTGPAA